MSMYSELLSKGKDVIAALELPFKVKKEEKKLEMKILELEQKMANDALTVQEQKSSCPVDWDKLIKAINQEALNKRTLDQLQSLQKELFSKK